MSNRQDAKKRQGRMRERDSMAAHRLRLGGGLLIAVFAASLAGCDADPATVNGSTEANGAAAKISETAAVRPIQPTLDVAGRPKLKPGARTKVLARAGDKPYDKTFDDLRFDMQVGEKFQRSMLTKEIEAMHGQRIRIRGYILPTAQKHGIRQFVLVRDNQECCFGPGAALYDCILIEMKPGKTTDFTIRPIAVEGTFNIKEFVEGGRHLAIYQMDGETAGER
jgi:hypothetical protein